MGQQTEWIVQAADHRRLVTVTAAGYERRDRPVEVTLDRANRSVVDVVELDSEGRAKDTEVPFQSDGDALTVMLTGVTPPHDVRTFHVYVGQGPQRSTSPQVRLTESVEHEGQDSFRIETPSATYYYHKSGAGFASMEDRDGLDWIGYHPGGESAGEYRGIPNLVHPEGHFHPGGTHCTSRVIAAGPLKVTIFSESEDGEWACRWDVYPAYAKMAVLRAGHPYWFLYEGTPGGCLDEKGDFVVRSTGVRTPASESWEGAIPEPEWAFFGAGNASRVLYLAHHEADDLMDSYWPMRGEMTVFGFGRLGLEKFMVRTPARFTVGFCEQTDFEAVEGTVNSAFREIGVTVGRPERRPNCGGQV